MTRFEPGTHLPRASGSSTWLPLVDLHGGAPDSLADNPIDLRRADFHPAGERHVSQDELLAWRNELNAWAQDRSYPSTLQGKRTSAWDVDLGTKLLEDTAGLPEALHPDVWCWIATNLLPHFVVYRWDWPALKDEAPSDRPISVGAIRFGPQERSSPGYASHPYIRP